MAFTLPPPELIPVHRLVALPRRVPASEVHSVVAEAFASVDPPLGEDLQTWLSRDMIRFDIGPMEVERLPPRQLLEHMGLAEEEAERLDGATCLVDVRAGDLPHGRRSGFWAATVAARAVARALEGVVVVPARRMVEPIDELDAVIAADGGIVASEHLRTAGSKREGGHWITTVGMTDFGLPNLELREVPAAMARHAALIVRGAAQVVLDAQARHGESAERETPRELATLELGLADILRAHGESGKGPSVFFEVTGVPSDGQYEPMLRVHAPGDEVEMGIWLDDVQEVLFGARRAEVRDVPTDDATMQAAKERARSELNEVRERFAGLGPGWQLYLKVGFDTPDDSVEFMWVGVEAWTGALVEGVLSNDPQLVPDLHAGQRVRILQGQVCDWLLSGPDGEREGGYTVDVLMERE